MTPTFKTNYILIDYENVQPKNLELLKGDHFKVYVFVGAKQTNVRIELALALQSFGQNGKYIIVSGTQPDALDFHIAFYIGELATQDEGAWFHIISKDKGFDPLIVHLRERGINVSRRELLTDIPLLRISNKATGKEKIDAVVKSLVGRGHSRPRKKQTLANTINASFKEPLTDAQLTRLIDDLQTQKYIKITAGKVTYNLPHPETK